MSESTTSQEINQATNLANLIGDKFGVKCKYEKSTKGFQWNFYRANRYVTCTANPKRVVSVMEKLIAVQ